MCSYCCHSKITSFQNKFPCLPPSLLIAVFLSKTDGSKILEITNRRLTEVGEREKQLQTHAPE